MKRLCIAMCVALVLTMCLSGCSQNTRDAVGSDSQSSAFISSTAISIDDTASITETATDAKTGDTSTADIATTIAAATAGTTARTTRPPTSAVTSPPSTAKATATSGNTTTATAPTAKDPWRWPYDVAVIYAECKKEVERLGVIWDDNLRIDNSGWTGNTSTKPDTENPDILYLKDSVWDMIHFNLKIGGVRSCRIWFDPDVQNPGDYLMYFLWLG